MRRFVLLIGVLLPLIAVETEAVNEKNTRNFLSWGSDNSAAAGSLPVIEDDITLDGLGEESSGAGDTTHADDEDFDVGSGDDDLDKAYVDISRKEDEDKTYPDEDWTLDKKTAGYTTDDEDLYDDMSGSGDDMADEDTVVEVTPSKTEERTTTSEPVLPPLQLSPCQNLRKTAISVAQFVPECDEEGAFKTTQCVDIGEERQCWCVRANGKEVEGTRMISPDVPDCAFGRNLGGCVFQLVQNGQNMLGAYMPNCSRDGLYAPLQCEGSMCWCVDKLGNQFTGSFSEKPNIPKCDQFLNKTSVVKQVTAKPTTKAPLNNLPVEPDDGYNVIDNGQKPTDDIDVKIPPKIGHKDREEKEEKTNTIGDEEDDPSPLRQDQPILAQPGLLAAIIGGAVVGLLCMVLLVMFVVYRMRKKDEGSYPLEEQKYQNYSYAKAPDKEFYA